MALGMDSSDLIRTEPEEPINGLAPAPVTQSDFPVLLDCAVNKPGKKSGKLLQNNRIQRPIRDKIPTAGQSSFSIYTARDRVLLQRSSPNQGS